MQTANYLDKVKTLSEPWCNFRIDKDFFATFDKYSDDQGAIREIIYSHFPDSPSISLGALPPIISPMLWETVSGLKREEIYSFKFKGQPISRVAYKRYSRIYDYQRKTIKVYLVNPAAYVESLEKGCETSGLSTPEIIDALRRRLKALILLRESIEQGNWPRLLLIVPTKQVKDKDISFTVTSRLEINLYRSEGSSLHHGNFVYFASETQGARRIFMTRWRQAHDDYAAHRPDFPRDLLSPGDIPLFEPECRSFNIKSVDILQGILEELIMKHQAQSEVKKKILILAANPRLTEPLRLDYEIREIDEGLRRSNLRDRFEIQSKLAVRLKDFRRALLDHEPNIVHFTGHAKKEGLFVEDETGLPVLLSTKALAGLFQLCSGHVECVILSACYTARQATAINKHIEFVIGMKKEIGDGAAIEFAVGFYDALGAGRTIEEAFNFGRNAILLKFPDLSEHLIPVLKIK